MNQTRLMKKYLLSQLNSMQFKKEVDIENDLEFLAKHDDFEDPPSDENEEEDPKPKEILGRKKKLAKLAHKKMKRDKLDLAFEDAEEEKVLN